MESVVSILITSCIPALISGIVTYVITCKKAKDEIMKLQESNKHEIEKLMKQHDYSHVKALVVADICTTSIA